ncbi:MAG: histone deacetylase [Candidatus Thermoplasmatota archaeon]|jgi:acetoin utilization deacetylase AcuC-like enzyme|nr:histone deacetylase [Candidatus Thermoplasmatota archaeon]
MVTKIVYSKQFNKHDNPGHPENAKRLNVMLDEIKKSPFYEDLEFVEPEILSEKCLYEVHSETMIELVKQISLTGDTWIDLDTYVCKNDYETARLAAGGLLTACKDVVFNKSDNAFALVRPPGHHANKNRSMGFCLFNNAAIAANELAKMGKKVLIFDFDVHHGNGTQEIFYDRNDVMYQSLHLSPHYPGTGSIQEIGIGKGVGFTINAPLNYGNGDAAVTRLLNEIFLPIAKQFKPDIIIMSCGYDSHHQDPLGGLKLTSNFYAEIIKSFQEVQPKIACTLEGGYNLKWIGKCVVAQLGQMTGKIVVFDDKTEEEENVDELIKQLRNELKKYWDI